MKKSMQAAEAEPKTLKRTRKAHKPAEEIKIPKGAKKRPMPGMVKPMLATLIDAPFDSEDWVFELKWDGYRALANIEDGQVSLYSRNGISFERYETIVEELKGFQHDVILDGEIVAMDENGMPRFQFLQNYERRPDVLIQYYVFDIIYFDGYDLTHVPLLERKKLLEQLLAGKFDDVVYNDHIARQGLKYFKAVQEKDLEGIIGKKADSLYHLDSRSNEWVKIKTQKRQEAVIVGYTEPKGSRSYFGSLILGVYDNGILKWAGSSGGGFNSRSLKAVYEMLQPLVNDKYPFKVKIPKKLDVITWVRPELVCEVAFSEWTDDGTMRHPVFMGLRPDKSAKQVVREEE
jgi:bifunctional non-homologous end joining protein LigD